MSVGGWQMGCCSMAAYSFLCGCQLQWVLSNSGGWYTKANLYTVFTAALSLERYKHLGAPY